MDSRLLPPADQVWTGRLHEHDGSDRMLLALHALQHQLHFFSDVAHDGLDGRCRTTPAVSLTSPSSVEPWIYCTSPHPCRDFTFVDDVVDSLRSQRVVQRHRHQGVGVARQLADGPLHTQKNKVKPRSRGSTLLRVSDSRTSAGSWACGQKSTRGFHQTDRGLGCSHYKNNLSNSKNVSL